VQSLERHSLPASEWLGFSRLQTGKFNIDKQETDVAQILRDEVALLKVVADQRSVEMDLKIDKKVPLITADSEKIRQVMLNMIDNAIYYSNPHKKVIISLKSGANEIEFTVKDSGIGVPKSEQANKCQKKATRRHWRWLIFGEESYLVARRRNDL